MRDFALRSWSRSTYAVVLAVSLLLRAGSARAELEQCVTSTTLYISRDPDQTEKHRHPREVAVTSLPPTADFGFLWRTFHDPVAFFSAILAIAALFQGAIYIVQLSILRETNRISFTTAEIARLAKEESDAQRKAQNESQRARLRIIGHSVIDVIREDAPQLVPCMLGAVFTIRNDGLTSAMLREVLGDISVVAASESAQLRPASDDYFETIPPEGIKRRTITGQITQESVDRINSGSGKIVVSVVFKYYDSFGGEHETSYRAHVEIGKTGPVLTPIETEHGNYRT